MYVYVHWTEVCSRVPKMLNPYYMIQQKGTTILKGRYDSPVKNTASYCTFKKGLVDWLVQFIVWLDIKASWEDLYRNNLQIQSYF
jgi:hypothetical protein